jgi:hypothetical protein
MCKALGVISSTTNKKKEKEKKKKTPPCDYLIPFLLSKHYHNFCFIICSLICLPASLCINSTKRQAEACLLCSQNPTLLLGSEQRFSRTIL